MILSVTDLAESQ